ncbi:hypothetical protein ANCCAN_09973 [Ancylostoma caninum]|uniref:MARVEL domain-containing protein n=1 Tax=Ancylostoma caninum TaxID=29170 RepID=A0A368GK32_ANCCA|nr:hypothetical protein ANCCAN_09973 [Ancylostoma caninum]
METDLAARVKLICGIFLSISIVSTVLACALWDFQEQTPTNNVLYISGLLLAFLLNSGIAYSLLAGTLQQRSSMFFPYIVCASIYIVVSTCGVGFFLGSTIYSLATRTKADHAYAAGIFLLLLVFWYWSLRTVKAYRNYISKISGEHVIFNNPEYV